jgi:hypothetical protein
MTVEEALVALLAIVASIFLFLGLVQAFGMPPALPRRPENRPAGHRQVSGRNGITAERTAPAQTTTPANQGEGESREPR